MFNSLASYILGNGNRNATDITQDDQQLSGASDEAINNFKFVTTICEDEDEEWLLVEKGDGDCTPQQTDSEEEIPFVEIKNSRAVRAVSRHSRNNSNVGSHDGAFNSLPSSPVPNSMDESWFVTPPPCFTATDPCNVEISPLENLLIEHPSMSVYHSIRGSMQPSTVDEDVEDPDGLVVVDLNAESEPDVPAIHPASDRVSGQTMQLIGRNRVESHNHLTAQQVKQVFALKHSQKAHDKKNRQQMCRNAMERGNKVREVNSKGGRQKRSDMTHCKVISRANNNRKC